MSLGSPSRCLSLGIFDDNLNDKARIDNEVHASLNISTVEVEMTFTIKRVASFKHVSEQENNTSAISY